MKTSDNGINLLKSFEGCVLYAYDDLDGYWPHKKTNAQSKIKGTLTIGYGHTGNDVKAGMVISQNQAIEFLKKDLVRFENYVTKTGLQLNQNQFDALVSFTYNNGPGGLQQLVKNRTLSQIADAMLLYNKSKGKVLSGLTKRRAKERELFLSSQNIENTYKVTASALNIRSGAGVKYSVVGILKQGAIVTVEAIQNGWGKISGGYVSMNYIVKC